jgi:fermentation-respiration switch protein FrsA (DUF1100 family)
MVVLQIILILVVLILLAGFILSFRLTRRSYINYPTRSPAELELEFEDVTFTATDGVKLRGWFIPGSDPKRAIVQLHGHGGSMDPDVQYLPAWHSAGFSVLMFDFRAHGRSEGRVTTFGYLEQRDALGAVRWLRQRGYLRVGLVGFSLGAMTSILTAGGNPEVDLVVADGSPDSVYSALRGWCTDKHLPDWLSSLIVPLVIFCASLRLQTNYFRHGAVDWVEKIAPRPWMMIHGDHDQYVSRADEMIQRGNPTVLWRLADMGHVQAKDHFPEEYLQRVVSFLNHCL